MSAQCLRSHFYRRCNCNRNAINKFVSNHQQHISRTTSSHFGSNLQADAWKLHCCAVIHRVVSNKKLPTKYYHLNLQIANARQLTRIHRFQLCIRGHDAFCGDWHITKHKVSKLLPLNVNATVRSMYLQTPNITHSTWVNVGVINAVSKPAQSKQSLNIPANAGQLRCAKRCQQIVLLHKAICMQLSSYKTKEVSNSQLISTIVRTTYKLLIVSCLVPSSIHKCYVVSNDTTSYLNQPIRKKNKKQKQKIDMTIPANSFQQRYDQRCQRRIRAHITTLQHKHNKYIKGEQIIQLLRIIVAFSISELLQRTNFLVHEYKSNAHEQGSDRLVSN